MEYKNSKISFCTVSMNRLHQLKDTLTDNINLYKEAADVEFILLDYNSTDGMEEWVRDNLSEFIESGLLTYYRTPDPQVFSHSHSKNMIFKLAKGDILCSINADHYIGADFDHYIRGLFKKKPSSFITPYLPPGSKNKYIPPKDVVGKVCVKSADFHRITGFDERFKNYGFEDVDFVKRLEATGLKRITLNKPEFLKFIEHSDDERIQASNNTVFEIYVHFISPASSEVIYLNSDGTYDRVTYMRVRMQNCDDYRHLLKVNKYIYDFAIKNNHWETGNWSVKEKELVLTSPSNPGSHEFLLDEHVSCIFTEDGTKYSRIQKASNKINLNAMRSFMRNLSIMEKNIAGKKIKINKTKFGLGRIYKNFNDEYTAI